MGKPISRQNEVTRVRFHPAQTGSRAVFLAEVREAEAEYKAGDARTFDDVDQLLDELRA